MTSSPAHVFVCYGTLSLEAACRIAARLREQEPAVKLCFLLLLRGNVAQIPPGAEIFQLPRPLRAYSRWVKPFAVADWFARVLPELERYPRLVVYLPHPAELPGNHFLFWGRETDAVELLPDGLVNYFERTLRPERLMAWPRYLVRVSLELLAARWQGLRYRPLLRGHITQYETGRYRRSWTFNERGYRTVSGELERIPTSGTERSTSEATGRLLFIDQEIREIVDEALEKKLRRRATEVLISLAPREVQYKAHPRGKNRADELRQRGLVVSDLSTEEAAENLIARVGVDRVVGFYSTTLALLTERDVQERISILPLPTEAGVLRPRLVAELRATLVAAGVRLAGGEACYSSAW